MKKPLTHSLRWLIGLILLLVPLSLAQRVQVLPLPPHQQDQDPFRIKVELVVLHVTVLNDEHQPVTGLDKAAFQIYENGVLQEIESFRHEDLPVTVGLVIDNSGSMRTKRTEVIAAAQAFAQASNPNDQHFLVNFNEYVTFGLPADLPFTSDLTQLAAVLTAITANGKTALNDAVAAALTHLKKGNRDKQVLIVVSDGADNASQYDTARILTLAKKSEAIIYTLGIFEPADPDRNPGALKQFAKATGGEAFFPHSVTDATAICERIARDIRSQYTLTYEPANLTYDGNYRAIQVKAKVPGGAKLAVRARAGYYAPLKP
jgi:Ca-activated chloride channel family protein